MAASAFGRNGSGGGLGLHGLDVMNKGGLLIGHPAIDGSCRADIASAVVGNLGNAPGLHCIPHGGPGDVAFWGWDGQRFAQLVQQ